MIGYQAQINSHRLPKEEQKLDVIIAGFGLSGMAVVYEMSKFEGFRDKRILVIDSSKKNVNDRTWSFWSKEHTEYEALATKTWGKGFFYTGAGEEIKLELDNYQYLTIKGIDFYDFILDKLKSFDNIGFLQSTIKETSSDGYVITDQGRYTADLICRSYFEKKQLKGLFKKSFIWQHFKGFLIETEDDVFNENEFTVMDYRQSSKGKINFFYVLPFTKRTALVEFTEFSKKLYTDKEYNHKVHGYIKEVLEIKNYGIVEEESNAIPMTSARGERSHDKIINIGTVAGCVKPTTGYAFTRIVGNSKLVARSIMKGDNLPRPSLKSFAYRTLDTILLDILEKKPDIGKAFFYELFKKVKACQIFCFLDEKATLTMVLNLFNSTRKHSWPFIRSFLSIITKIVIKSD